MLRFGISLSGVGGPANAPRNIFCNRDAPSLVDCRIFLPIGAAIAMEKAELERRKLLYITVGQSISNWARVEGRLVLVLAALLKCKEEKAGVILYSILSFPAWLSIIDELFLLEPQFSQQKKKWGKISEKLRNLNSTRIRLAHHTVPFKGTAKTFKGQSEGEDGSPILRAAREDSRSKSSATAMSANQIIEFTNAVTKLGSDLAEVIGEMRIISASPGK